MTINELLAELVRFESVSPPGNEKGCARFVQDYIDDLRIPDCTTDLHDFSEGRANLVVRIGPRNPGLLLSGHIDVVPAGDPTLWQSPPFEIRSAGGRLFGRGVADMKGGVASMMKAVEAAKHLTFKRQLTLVATAGEEVGFDGLQKLISDGRIRKEDAMYGVVGEPTGLKVARAHKGVSQHRITFHGRSAHASRPDLGVNAIEQASLFISELKKVRRRLGSRRHRFLGTTTFEATMISGGTKENIIPEKAEVVVDCRRIPDFSVDDIRGEIQVALKEVRKQHASLKAESEVIRAFGPLDVPEQSPIVLLLEKLTRSKSISVPYATEAPEYGSLGIPTVVFGPGSIQQAHTTDEYVEEKELLGAVSIYEKLIRRVCA